MIRRILVPLDGSSLATTILPEVAALVRLTGAQLTLLRVLEPLPLSPELTETIEVEGFGGDMDTRRLADAREELSEVADRLAAEGLPVAVRVEAGLAADEIIDQGRAFDLIAMATHGRSGIGRWVYGSVADRVLRGATVPVLLLRAQGHPSPVAEPPRRILVALDGSPLAERVIPLAAMLAERSGGLLILAHCVNWSTTMSLVVPEAGAVLAAAEALEVAESQGRDYTEEVAGRLRQSTGLTVLTDVRLGSPYDGIVTAAGEHQADLIVMSSHGRGGLTRWMLGSVAERVLQTATLPILLVRSGATAESAAPAADRSAVGGQ